MKTWLYSLSFRLVVVFSFIGLLLGASLLYQTSMLTDAQRQLDNLTRQQTSQTAQEQQLRITSTTIANARTIHFVSATALFALAVVAVVLVTRSVFKSLSKIKEGAQRFANGDFSQTISVNSQDQVGDVAAAFNQMAERQKESYHRLALEKQRDEALLESMGEGVVATDELGRLVLVNSVATELLELPSRADSVGKPLFELYKIFQIKNSKTVPDLEQPIHITLHTGQPSGDVFSFKRKNNQKILLGMSAYPVILNEKTVGAIMIVRDVTKEKEIDRMKTEFISLASHQLRTPLSAIKWFSEMLIAGDAGKLSAEQLDFAQNISDSTQRMIELVNSLLNISRIESGRIIIDPRPTDLEELVTGIVNDLKAKIEERQQNLAISVHKDLPKINLDPRLIGQVYLNLLTNAIKYTPKGGEIVVFVSRKGDNVLSQVTDNGYGIPKSQQAKIFQKFFRAENIVKVETDGTGLGLYLIKSIVESSGGKIWFESKENEGTSFWFTIPLRGMKAKEGEVSLDA